MIRRAASLTLFLIIVFPLDASAGVGNLLTKIGISKKTTINDTRIGEGLKETLRVGINKAVEITGRTDGYLKNNQIKIPLPEKVQRLEPLLRKTGFGPKVDELVLSMNRAAEQAAPYARDLFIEAIASMSFEDVEKIYKGGDTAATDYLKAKTSGKLSQVYRPVVAKAMQQYDVARQYQNVEAKFKSLPMAGMLKIPDVEDYVVSRSLDGLFLVLAEQEKKIRTDPSAQATQLLKDLFSSAR